MTGNDKREMYALGLPARSTTLIHVATISIPTAGQAIAWDPLMPRMLWSIERPTKMLVSSLVPDVKK